MVLLDNYIVPFREGYFHGVITVSKNYTGRLTVSFQYDPLFVQKVRTIEGRKWHPAEKYWSFPDSDGTLERILKVKTKKST